MYSTLDWHRWCDTVDEILLNEDVCEKLPDIPVAEVVVFSGLSNGRRSTEIEARRYDRMAEKMIAERRKECGK